MGARPGVGTGRGPCGWLRERTGWVLVEAEQKAGPWMLWGGELQGTFFGGASRESNVISFRYLSGSFGSYVGNGKLGEKDDARRLGSQRDDGGLAKSRDSHGKGRGMLPTWK